MKLVFAGTPDFAAASLKALIDHGHDITLVLTQPDRPAGRGMQLQAPPVKQLALAHGIDVLQPLSLRKGEDGAAAVQRLKDIAPQVVVVAAYGLILPQNVLDIPAHGCINVHASLLPRWRGAAPIHRAIEAGDTQTGITIMQMEAGLDTGPMRLIRATPISPQHTTASLHDELATLGGQAIVQALDLLAQNNLPLDPQPEQGVTYAHKIEKSESPLHFERSAPELANQIRAFDPFPGCTVQWVDGSVMKVWGAAVSPSATGSSAPGTVLGIHKDGIDVACGQGALRLTQLQRPGGKRQPAAQVLQAQPLLVGDVLRTVP